MKIGISGEWIGTKAGGLETYSSNLIHSLAKSDSSNTYLIYTAYKDALVHLGRDHENLSLRYLGSESRWLAIPLLLPYWLLRDDVDVFHATSIAPPFCPARLIVTVHDLGFRKHPEFYPKWVRYRLDKLITSGIRRAAKIIAVSEFTKRDIMDCYGIEETKIAVVHEGVNDLYRPIDDVTETARVLRHYGIPESYLLYVGRLHGGKNLIRLLQAYAAVKNKSAVDQKLVLVGRELFDAKPIYQEISRLGLDHEVIRPGYVNGEDLPHIYCAATAFVYPSLFEGFGLPPLEAMACGTPVVSSSAASLAEIVGDAGLLVDPYSVEDITENLYKVLTDPSLRAELRRRGLARAKQFSWENTAIGTRKVYEQTLS